MREVDSAADKLPLAVYEDIDTPLKVFSNARNEGGPTSASSPPAEQGNQEQGSNGHDDMPDTRVQRKRKQPEVISESLAGSVMMLRSQQINSAPIVQLQAGSKIQQEFGQPDELLASHVVTRPPSPLSLEILGKSRGLKRARLQGSQPTPSPKKPASHLQPQKAAAPDPSCTLPPLPAQPMGSNWWEQGPLWQPMQGTKQWAAAYQPAAGQSPAVQHMEQPEQQSLPCWQPPQATPNGARPGNRSVLPPGIHPAPSSASQQQYNGQPSGRTRGATQQHPQPGIDGQMPPPLWQEPEQPQPWSSSDPVSQQAMVPAPVAAKRPSAFQPSMGSLQPPQAMHPNGRGGAWPMQDLMNEVLAYDDSAEWSDSAGQQQRTERNGFCLRDGEQHGIREVRQRHLQHEQALLAPNGGNFTLGTVSKKQRAKKRVKQKQQQAQHTAPAEDFER